MKVANFKLQHLNVLQMMTLVQNIFYIEYQTLPRLDTFLYSPQESKHLASAKIDFFLTFWSMTFVVTNNSNWEMLCDFHCRDTDC